MNVIDFRNIVGQHYVGGIFPEFLLRQLESVDVSTNVLGRSGQTDALGRPYFMKVGFTKEGKRMTLQYEPLVSVSLQKNIVKTSLIGSKHIGTVKEYIGQDDYNISIIGMCINEESDELFPYNEVKTIKDLAEFAESLEIHNELLNSLFDVHEVVIESVEFSDMQGKPNSQIYNIKCVSDYDFLADLKNKELTNLLKAL